jgi:hypothetical protein
MSDQLRTVDDLFEWLNDKFGCHLPRLADVNPRLKAFWRMSLINPPSKADQPSYDVHLAGEWAAVPDLVLIKLQLKVTES